jgi:AcrR family transcriptional regulator
MARPRSARAHTDVLDAAQKLFAERGIDATSMDAIAAASGVSKATIYKHWPDKDALCLEVMVRIHGRDEPPLDFDSGDLRADLIAVLGHRPPERYAAVREQITPHLMAYSARNPEFATAWRARALNSPRAQLLTIVQRAISRGQLPATIDTDIAIALLFGPSLYAWILKSLDGRTLPENFHVVAVDAFLRSYGLPTTTPRAARASDRSASRGGRESRSRARRRPAESS